jgi:hypothetical protein
LHWRCPAIAIAAYGRIVVRTIFGAHWVWDWPKFVRPANFMFDGFFPDGRILTGLDPQIALSNPVDTDDW